MSIKLESLEQFLHVEDWAQGLDWVGHHWHNHLVVAELIRLAVCKEYHANVPAFWEANLLSGEAFDGVELSKRGRHSRGFPQ